MCQWCNLTGCVEINGTNTHDRGGDSPDRFEAATRPLPRVEQSVRIRLFPSFPDAVTVSATVNSPRATKARNALLKRRGPPETKHVSPVPRGERPRRGLVPVTHLRI
jgi:hypothetical protein